MMYYTVFLGQKGSTNFAIIAAIPPIVLVVALTNAMLRMKGSGGANY